MTVLKLLIIPLSVKIFPTPLYAVARFIPVHIRYTLAIALQLVPERLRKVNVKDPFQVNVFDVALSQVNVSLYQVSVAITLLPVRDIVEYIMFALGAVLLAYMGFNHV